MSSRSGIAVEISTLVDLLRMRAEHQPEAHAYTFLTDGETTEVRLDYAELDRRARMIAARLEEVGAAGARALLLFQPGLDFIAAFFGCLYANVIAVPAYPPHPARLARTLPRLRAIVQDARPVVALTTAELMGRVETLFGQDPDFGALRFVATDDLDADLAERWTMPAIDSATVAFLQYTSGSTSTPKGVIVSHGNLLHNEQMIKLAFGHDESTVVVGWLPLYHDMGLIGNVLQPLYLGTPCILMSPVAFLQRPLRWLEAISRYRATTSGGPNFAYDLCVRATTPEQRAALDLSSWQVAFNGAEPIRAETLDRFAEAFAPAGFRREAFYPCYGMAETTLFVTGHAPLQSTTTLRIDASALEQHRIVPTSAGDHAQLLVGCGHGWMDQQLAIVDPETGRSCPPDQVGEIWVSGPSVAQGYWNRPEVTAQTFGAQLADTGAGPFLRTGDLGFIADGELYVTGRLKDLIIIRGRNHYPQDIELTAEQSHPALRPGCGAAFSIEVGGEERLVVVQEVDRHFRQLDLDAVAGDIRRAVAENHELQAYAVVLLKPGSLPKTSSGKIQRHAARAGFLAGTLEAVGSNVLDETAFEASDETLTRDVLLATEPPARTALLTSYLQGQVARVLRIAAARVDVTQPISALGLDSLMAVELEHTIESQIGVVVPMVSFLEGASIAQLSAELLPQIAEATTTNALVPVESSSAEHPLSFGQRALWFLYELAPASAAYNIVSAVRIRAALDVPALRRALQTLIDRHAALRTTYHQRAAQSDPVQLIHPQLDVSFETYAAAGLSEAALHERLTAEAHRPFDLQHGPLLRAQLWTHAVDEHVLLLAIHHIAADMWSLTVLTHELAVLYAGERAARPAALAPLALRYVDYAAWQAALMAGAEGERLWRYWERQLAGPLPVLELPADYPRPPVQTYRGAAHAFRLDPALTAAIKALGQAQGATLYTTLLAAFQTLLHRYTGQEDILVGSPTSGRSRAELAEIVGYFVNSIVVRANLGGNPRFAAVLQQVRQTVLDAFAHQDYPFVQLVERLHPERDPSRSPIFQVMFALQKAHLHGEEGLNAFALGESGAQMQLGELLIESLGLEQRVAQFDLTLMMAEAEGGLVGSLQYNADLFEAATIARIADHYRELLTCVVADPARRVGEVPLLTAAEQQLMLRDWNASAADYPRDAALHQLFEAQVARTPETVAVVYEGQSLTYRELNARANQLAHYLRAQGVQPDQLVALALERSPEMIVGILGILKAGAAYVPLDPEYPVERLAYMLQDTQAPVLLTQQRLLHRLPHLGAPSLAAHQVAVVCLDADWDEIAPFSAENPPRVVKPEHRAYLIYTSGSTGRPKGVMVQRRGLINLVYGLRRFFDDPAVQQTGLITSISFDISVNQIFPTLVFGRTLHIIPEAVKLDAEALMRYLVEHEIQLLDGVPSYFQAILQEIAPATVPTALRYLLIGGEKLETRLLQAIFGQLGHEIGVVNIYGLTEITDINAFGVIHEADLSQPVTVGRPLQNNRIYIVNEQLEAQPIGVTGEVCVAGDSVSRGYLNRPELTAEKFVVCPFEAGQLMCRTGDLGRWRADGTIEILGRRDHQVKIRGYRIETGEIEAALAATGTFREVVVIVRDDGEKRLVAYLVPLGSETPTTSDLRRALQATLPEYMIPSAFVMMERLPRTPNGKIDRKALPAPDTSLIETGAYVAPRTPAEAQIAAIWAAVLGVEQVGVNDNFFEIGGHSLKATQVIARLRETFQMELPLHTLFEEPTVARLASLIGSAQPTQPADIGPIVAAPRGEQSIDALLAQLDDVDDNDVLDLLKELSQPARD